jgi:hypothetical protein
MQKIFFAASIRQSDKSVCKIFLLNKLYIFLEFRKIGYLPFFYNKNKYKKSFFPNTGFLNYFSLIKKSPLQVSFNKNKKSLYFIFQSHFDFYS